MPTNCNERFLISIEPYCCGYEGNALDVVSTDIIQPTDGNSAGSIGIKVSGGTGPYKFMLTDNAPSGTTPTIIRNWQVNETFSRLPMGEYRIVAMDSCGLTSFYTVVLSGPTLYTVSKTELFTKNNCDTNAVSQPVPFTKYYSSYVSQEFAEAQRDGDTNYHVEGQIYANANGVCTIPDIHTYTRVQRFVKNNCPAGKYPVADVEFTKDYTSSVSDVDAYNIAMADNSFNTEGQAFANSTGTCADQVTYFATRSEAFTKNNCPVGGQGAVVMYLKQYLSTVSQADANAKSTSDTNYASEGQTYANNNGACLYTDYTATRTGKFTKPCGNGTYSPAVLFTKSYISNQSQAQAEAIADLYFQADGLAYAETHAVCTYTATRTGTFTRNNCSSPATPGSVTFTKTYTSYVSQTDANATATADTTFTAEGQAYANANASCSLNTYTVTKTGTFTKQCGTGTNVGTVNFSKTYSSNVSQADAQATADANFNADGQAYANANGVCTYSTFRSAIFTKNNCASGYVGSQVSYSQTYTSLVSQADADNIASSLFDTEGQAWANERGVCTYVPPTTYSAYRVGNFTKNNCHAYETGTTVTFSNTYTSTVSQADADAIASANFNTDGQAYANSAGTCNANTVYTASRSGNFTRNNCGSGYTGGTVSFSKSYDSYVSQADADAIANANFATDGQNYANGAGSCNIVTYSAYRSGTFTKNDCGANYTGSNVAFNRTYTSTISQADADAKANTYFNADGQAWANERGTCSYVAPTVYTAYRSGSFTRNNCGANYVGGSVNYSNSYESTVSQASAEAIADSQFSTQGQAYANANATCTYVPPVIYSAYRSGSFTRNNCATGFIGGTETYSKTYTSTVSQADADAIANANFNADGQAYINAYGTCTGGSYTVNLYAKRMATGIASIWYGINNASCPSGGSSISTSGGLKYGLSVPYGSTLYVQIRNSSDQVVLSCTQEGAGAYCTSFDGCTHSFYITGNRDLSFNADPSQPC